MKPLTIILVVCATLTTAKELLGQKGGGHDPDSLWCLGQCWQAGKKKCVGTSIYLPDHHLPHHAFETKLNYPHADNKVHECLYKDMCWHEMAICSRACTSPSDPSQCYTVEIIDVMVCVLGVTFPWAQCLGHAPKEDDGFPPVEVEVAPSVSSSGFDQGPEVSWDDDGGEIDWGNKA
jgi:hypothetical protein